MLNWPFLTASHGGLPSPAAEGALTQCLKVTAAAKEGCAGCWGVPSFPEAAHSHFKPGDRDGIFAPRKSGLLSGRG